MGCGRMLASGACARTERSRQDAAICSSRNGTTMIVSQPDTGGHFGPYGGRYVPEVLMAPLEELEQAYIEARSDAAFEAELTGSARELRRPADSAVFRPAAESDSRRRADLSEARRSPSHRARTRSTTASARRCWPRRMGKQRIIAETGAGQHGVATATACALFGLECVVYMGAEDMRRQQSECLPHAAAWARSRRREQRQPAR